VVRRYLQQVLDAHEAGLLVYDHARIGTDAHLAVGKGVECVGGNVRRNAGGQFDGNFDLGGGIIFDFAHLDLSLVVRFQYRIDQLGGGNSIGHVLDEQRFLI